MRCVKRAQRRGRTFLAKDTSTSITLRRMNKTEKENSPPRTRQRVRRQQMQPVLLLARDPQQDACQSFPQPSCSKMSSSNRRQSLHVKRKSRYEHRQSNYNRGAWTRTERLLFLKGLRVHGWGRWKEIAATDLLTRNVVPLTVARLQRLDKCRELKRGRKSSCCVCLTFP